MKSEGPGCTCWEYSTAKPFISVTMTARNLETALRLINEEGWVMIGASEVKSGAPCYTLARCKKPEKALLGWKNILSVILAVITSYAVSLYITLKILGTS